MYLFLSKLLMRVIYIIVYMTAKGTLKKLKKISLSNVDVVKLLDGKVNLVMYPDIKKYRDIDHLLGKYGACVILYLTSENYGHWCCIFRQGKRCIQFFDSYGEMIDKALEYEMDPKFRIRGGMNLPLLTKMLYDAYDKYNIKFNEFQFQEEEKDVNTCGRFCVVRLWCRDMDEYEFAEFMYSTKYSPDELVSILTSVVDEEENID